MQMLVWKSERSRNALMAIVAPASVTSALLLLAGSLEPASARNLLSTICNSSFELCSNHCLQRNPSSEGAANCIAYMCWPQRQRCMSGNVSGIAQGPGGTKSPPRGPAGVRAPGTSGVFQHAPPSGPGIKSPSGTLKTPSIPIPPPGPSGPVFKSPGGVK